MGRGDVWTWAMARSYDVGLGTEDRSCDDAQHMLLRFSLASFLLLLQTQRVLDLGCFW